MNREIEQVEWYARYYNKAGADRNELRANRGTLFQALAFEAAFIRAFYSIGLECASLRVLDVGCGSGSGLYQLTRLGVQLENITGIDVQSERITRGRALYPQVNFIRGDATAMQFPDDSFDLVMESTLFATLTNECDRAAIAREMVRVCRPGGYLLLIDWRTPKISNPHYRALMRRDVKCLFEVGYHTALIAVHRGAILPPFGRFLSRWLPALYFLVAALCPPLVGQVACVLQKK